MFLRHKVRQQVNSVKESSVQASWKASFSLGREVVSKALKPKPKTQRVGQSPLADRSGQMFRRWNARIMHQSNPNSGSPLKRLFDILPSQISNFIGLDPFICGKHA
jgi:hypothetical protein